MRERAGRPQRGGGQPARIVLAVVAVDSCRQRPFRRTRVRSRPREADLVPDVQVGEITERILTIVAQIDAGILRDMPVTFFIPSAYQAAHEALAALSERLTWSQAKCLLGYAHPELAERAVDQLLALLERASQPVGVFLAALLARVPAQRARVSRHSSRATWCYRGR